VVFVLLVLFLGRRARPRRAWWFYFVRTRRKKLGFAETSSTYLTQEQRNTGFFLRHCGVEININFEMEQ
jgi:hypothetical protein